MITTLSSREFNQDTSRAKKAALIGPVFITDRGKPAHVIEHGGLPTPHPTIQHHCRATCYA